jgi:hypothetical protein
MEEIFTKVYETFTWGSDADCEYIGSSGPGSYIEYNKDTYIPFLKKLIVQNNIKRIIDLGCGDFKCGPLIYNDLDISYIGYDTYFKVIQHQKKHYGLPKYNFIHMDFLTKKEEILRGHLCIIKDVLCHWSLKNIYNFLDYLMESNKFKYILICNSFDQTEDDTDIEDGQYRPLSCDYFPLKKYNPKKIYKYNTKEVSIIEVCLNL